MNTGQKQNWKAQRRGGGWKSHGGKGRGRNPAQGKQCVYCHKMNYTINECCFKHRYPTWFKQRKFILQ